MKFNFQKKASKGFSLIELIVAVSVIVIISSVALFHQAKFSSDILISNVAYEIALAIRQAQVYGISSKGHSDVSIAATEQYRVGYGLHFTAFESGGKPDSFVTFVDVPMYEATGPGENAEFDYVYVEGHDFILTPPSPIGLTQGQKIRRFCTHRPADDSWDCWNYLSPTNMTLDIVFVKPNPDANIKLGHNGVFDGATYDKAKIVIESGLGDKCRSVTVWISGQVSVDPVVPDAQNGGCEAPY